MCDADPAPGEVGDVEAAAAAIRAQADRSVELVGALEGFGFDTVGALGWEGASFDGFTTAFAQLPPRMGAQADALSDIAQQLHGWAVELSTMQAEADDLLDRAVQVDAELQQAQAQLAAAELQSAQAAGALLRLPAGDPDQRGAASAVAAARGQARRLRSHVTDLEAELAGLRQRAIVLADAHEAGATAIAGRLGDAGPAGGELPGFTQTAVQVAVAQVLGDVVDGMSLEPHLPANYPALNALYGLGGTPISLTWDQVELQAMLDEHLAAEAEVAWYEWPALVLGPHDLLHAIQEGDWSTVGVEAAMSLPLTRWARGGRLLGLATPVADGTHAGLMRLPASQSWGLAERLPGHHLKHGAEFAAETAEDYAGMASAFLQRGLREELPTRIDEYGVIRIYDPATNTFGSFNPDGTTRTFFRPTGGPAYMERQEGLAPWGPS